MTKLTEMFDSPEKAAAIAKEIAKEQQSERERIRSKLSEVDRKFLDELRSLFPQVRMLGIEFKDGEKVGRV